MSSKGELYNAFRALSGDDPKEIELVESIIEKTKAGKIVWEKNANSLVATLVGLQLIFVRSPSSNAPLGRILGGSGWDLFSVRKSDGTELVKVDQPPPVNIFFPNTATPPPARSKLLQAVDTLYFTADSKGQGEIDKAINAIKNL